MLRDDFNYTQTIRNPFAFLFYFYLSSICCLNCCLTISIKQVLFRVTYDELKLMVTIRNQFNFFTLSMASYENRAGGSPP